MVASLKGGWMIHPTTLRYRSIDYPDDGAFPDPVTRAIENERGRQYRAEGSHHENEYFITFTFLPDPLILNKIKEFAYDMEKGDKLSAGKVLERTVQHFQRSMAEYVSALESGLTEKLTQLVAVQKLDPKTHRMVWYDEQLSFIHECITGIKQQIRLPSSEVPTGVDYILGSYPFYPGVKPRINDMHIRVIAIESPPDAGTYFGILDVLNKLPIQYRWTTRWIARDQEVVKANIEKIRSKWRQKIRGFIAEYRGKTNGPINTDAQAMAEDAEAAINDINSGVVSYGQWTSTVVLFGTNETYIDQLTIYTLKEIRDMGFTCRSEEVNCNEAYLGSLPGHGYENVRRPEIHSLNLADTLPLTSTWQGPIENKCEFYKKFYPNNTPVPPLFFGAASGGTPFRVVLHNGDLGHTMIVGPTGAGKSTLLALIAASQFRYPNAKVFAFDKGESLLALCLGSGGTHYSFMDDTAINKDIGFAPLAQIHKLSERTWATDYIVTISELHNVTIDLDRRSEIKKAVDLLATRPVEMRTFTDLASLVQTREIRQVLHFYEEEGANGLLNKKSDNLKTSNFTVFEIEHLMEMSEVHIVPVLLYLFRVIERNLDGSPVLIPFDEGWLTLQHEVFKEKLREWLKVLRKANAAVMDQRLLRHCIAHVKPKYCYPTRKPVVMTMRPYTKKLDCLPAKHI
jgi:type IV secretion system protein VirB4